MNKLDTDDLCYVSNITTAAAIKGEPFNITNCEWYATCSSETKFIDPLSGAILDLKYCKTNPIYMGLFALALFILLLTTIILYFKYRGSFASILKRAEKPSEDNDDDEDESEDDDDDDDESDYEEAAHYSRYKR